MRINPSPLAIVAFLGVGLAACTPRPVAQPSPGLSGYDEVVEVSNNASFRVVVRYYTQGGGPHPLGTVGPLEREVFILPRADAGYILVQTEAGQRIEHSARLIDIRRYKVDRATGERISSPR